MLIPAVCPEVYFSLPVETLMLIKFVLCHTSVPTCSWSPVDATGDYRGSVRNAGGERGFTRPKVQCSGRDTYKGKHPQAPIPQTQGQTGHTSLNSADMGHGVTAKCVLHCLCEDITHEIAARL